MLSREKLWKLSSAARAKGWAFDQQDLPSDINDAQVFPDAAKIFRALELVSPSQVKTVIVGQDPYFSRSADGQPLATGVAFAVSGHETPLSLQRIKAHVYPKGQSTNDLADWADSKGLLLLNAALTVPATGNRKAAGKHLRHWREFFNTAIKQAHEAKPQAVVVAWGTKARDASASALGIDWQTPPSWFRWTYHPIVTKPGPHSFASFWKTDPGKALVMR